MKNTLITLFVLLACVAFQAQAGMKILQPADLKSWWDINPQATNTSLADFGYIPWGSNITGRIALAEPLDACDYIYIGDYNEVDPILLAVRGGCPFSTKAHYTQLTGAKMLIIVDNTDEEVDHMILVDVTFEGEGAHIPSALLTKQAGDKLISNLQDPSPAVSNVSMTFDFLLPKRDKVDYRMWLSSSNPVSYSLLKEWQPYAEKLNNMTEFSPHFKILAPMENDQNISNCICSGRYCSDDPKGNTTGADVVMEELRQMCILDRAGLEAWWRYIDEYDVACLTGGDMENCSKKTMVNASIDSEDIDDCVKDSFDIYDMKRCTSNARLDKEEKLLKQDYVALFPTVVINDYMYRGDNISGQGLFKAVCEAFNTIPNVCSDTLPPSDSLVTGQNRKVLSVLKQI